MTSISTFKKDGFMSQYYQFQENSQVDVGDLISNPIENLVGKVIDLELNFYRVICQGNEVLWPKKDSLPWMQGAGNHFKDDKKRKLKKSVN